MTDLNSTSDDDALKIDGDHMAAEQPLATTESSAATLPNNEDEDRVGELKPNVSFHHLINKEDANKSQLSPTPSMLSLFSWKQNAAGKLFKKAFSLPKRTVVSAGQR